MAALWPLLPLLGQPDEVVGAMRGYWFWICAFLIPFSVLTAFKSAFEAADKPWLGTAFAFLGVVINVPLNYALIWGIGPLPELGLTRRWRWGLHFCGGVTLHRCGVCACGALWR
jgi:MATE family multidrug resistance protein